MRYAAIIIGVVLSWGILGGDGLAPVPSLGLALGPQAAQAASYTSHPVRSVAEKRAIRRWGLRVGRWYDECDRYWPRAQLGNCMRCIKGESRGDTLAHNGPYHGLFQQDSSGVSVNLFKWYNSIRRAYLLWKSRGWQPWPWM